MSRAVTAGFDSLDQADEMLEQVTDQLQLLDVAVVSNSPAGRARLQNFTLPDDVRASCEQALERSGYLFVALVPDEATAERVLSLLASIRSQAPAQPVETSAAEQPASPAEEQRIPLVEDELRIGTREVVRGGARVRTKIVDTPVHEEVELLAEQASVDRRPVNRRLTDEEVVEAGLLKERVIEISEMREEAVVSKETFVREELVVRKTVEQRIEHIDETVRRTEATVEDISAGTRPAFSGLDGSRLDPQPRESAGKPH